MVRSPEVTIREHSLPHGTLRGRLMPTSRMGGLTPRAGGMALAQGHQAGGESGSDWLQKFPWRDGEERNHLPGAEVGGQQEARAQ